MIGQIIYIVSDKYNLFSEKFFDTLHLFMPSLDKVVTVLTDQPELYEQYKEKFNIEIYKFAAGPYPCVNLSKFANIKTFMLPDVDYVFYFDADTYFIEMSNIEQNALNLLNDNNIMIPYSLSYSLSFYENAYYEDQRIYRIYDTEILKNRTNESPDSPFYNEYFISDMTYAWLQTCFMWAKRDILYEFCDICNKRLKASMVIGRDRDMDVYGIPRLFDETVANKVNYEIITGEKTYNFRINGGAYAMLSEPEHYGFGGNVYVIQKYGFHEYKNHNL